jgi:ectoine hydroxylase-related dioxygenase (phytanoyl-CoA dioxygenase family)
MTPQSQFNEEGFYVSETSILPLPIVLSAEQGMQDVREGRYDTGRPPCPSPWNPGDSDDVLCKIENPQIASSNILACVSHPSLGDFIREVTGAEMVQVWWVQLLQKPSGGGTTTNVGWHQDYFYWKDNWESHKGLLTAWVAISDVSMDAGPMSFVPGSHKWGFTGKGDFFSGELETQKQELKKLGREWTERKQPVPQGGVSLHQSLTFHASGPNTSGAPRKSFAVHIRTEKAVPKGKFGLTEFLDDPKICPIISQSAALR